MKHWLVLKKLSSRHKLCPIALTIPACKKELLLVPLTIPLVLLEEKHQMIFTVDSTEL
jgi:hypothetical protein